MKRRKKLQIILVTLMALTLVVNMVLSTLDVGYFYAETTDAKEIDYVGNKLPSTNTVNSKTLDALTKSYGHSVVNYAGDTKGELLGLGELAFDKLDGIQNSASYSGLVNLVFNTLYCDSSKLKKAVSLSEIPDVKSLVHDYLYGGDYKNTANSIASSMLCSDYAVTLSGFNSLDPAVTKDGFDYYGPFKITDNTLGFSEFSSDNVELAVVNNGNPEKTKYAESDKTYYFRIAEGTTVDSTISFEGVHFNPEVQLYKGSVVACGEIVNKTFRTKVTLGSTLAELAEETVDTDTIVDVVEEDVDDVVGLITNTPTPTPNPYRVVNVNVSDSSLAGSDVYLMYDIGTKAECIHKVMNDGAKSVAIAVPNESFSCDIIAYNDFTNKYAKATVALGKNTDTVTLNNPIEHYAKEKKIVVKNLTECDSWDLGELTYNLFYTYNGKSIPIGDQIAAGASNKDYKVSQNLSNVYVIPLLDENTNFVTSATSKGYTISHYMNWSMDDTAEVIAKGEGTRCYNTLTLNVKAADGIECNQFKVDYTYAGSDILTKEVTDGVLDTFRFTKLGGESLRIDRINMFYKGQWVTAKMNGTNLYRYDAKYKGGSVSESVVCEPIIVNANNTPTPYPTNVPLPTDDPATITNTPVDENAVMTVRFTSNGKLITVKSLEYRLCYPTGTMSETKVMDINDSVVNIKGEGATKIVITSVNAEGYTIQPTAIDVKNGSSDLNIELQKGSAKVTLRIVKKGNSTVSKGTVMLTNQDTQTIYQSVIDNGEQVCYVDPGTYTLTLEADTDCYLVNPTITDLPLSVNGENVVEFITTDVAGTAYFTSRNTGGVPLEGIKITIDNDKTCITDASGTAEVKDLSYGKHTYNVTEVPEGYLIPASGTFTTTVDDSSAIELVISRKTGNLRVNKMIAGSNTFVKDAVYSVTENEAPYFTRTLSVSEFPISLEAGSYTIKEIIPGEGYSFSEERVKDITIPEDGTSQTVTFTTVGQTGSLLIDNYSVSSYNDKLSGVEYILLNLDGEEVRTVTSDESGKALIENIPLGSYTLKQTSAPEGYVRYKKFTSIKIEKAGGTVLYDAILAQVSGSVTVYHETATAGILYYLHNSENTLVDAVYTDGDGIALFNQLLPGTYTISCADVAQAADVTENKGLFGSLIPMTLYAFNGTATVSIDSPNVVVGSDKKSNVTSTQIGTSTIIPSSKAEAYDKTVAGIVSYGSVNVDSIAKVISEKTEPLDTSSDITETAIGNTIETADETDDDDDDSTSLKGDHYKTAAGNIVISSDNQNNGDADFTLTEKDVASMLNSSVKLPKTGITNMTTWFLIMLLLEVAVFLYVSRKDLKSLFSLILAR